MTAVDERSALDPGTSLFDHATRLLHEHPVGPLPGGGYPFPDDQPRRRRPCRVDSAAADALTEMLVNHFAEGGSANVELHDAIASLDVGPGTIELGVNRLTGHLGEDLRRTGVWLVRQATDRGAALVGLGLLVLAGAPDDVDLVKTICVLGYFAPTAPRALRSLGASTADLIWMVERARGGPRDELVDELCRRVTDRDAREWLLHNVSYDSFASSRARRLAEATALADLVGSDAVDDALFCLGSQALLAMATANDYRVEIGKFGEARRPLRMLPTLRARLDPSSRSDAVSMVSIEYGRRAGQRCHAAEPVVRRKDQQPTVASMGQSRYAAPGCPMRIGGSCPQRPRVLRGSAFV